MLATMSPQAITMSSPSSHQSSSKRPRLSLKIQATSIANTCRSSASLISAVDAASPTAFNTLSNAYAMAIEQSSPRSVKTPYVPAPLSKPTSLCLVTHAPQEEEIIYPSQRTQTPGPFTTSCPDTPASEYTTSTTVSQRTRAPVFTCAHSNSTPPDSAQEKAHQAFSFTSDASTTSPRIRRASICSPGSLPYTQPYSLQSILRNSPLPKLQGLAPRSLDSPFSARITHKTTNKRLRYNTPLTQTITTEKYVKSHIDLLAEDASPISYKVSGSGLLETTMAYTGHETRDGGQTPGPFEEMRRRMAGLGEEETMRDAQGNDGVVCDGNGLKKRKRSEKKRQWVWTIGNEEEDQEEASVHTLGPGGRQDVPGSSSNEHDASSAARLEAGMISRPGSSNSI